MKSIRQGVVFVSALVFASLIPGAALASKPKPQPKALMLRALKLTDIRTKGSPPFRLQGDVTIFHTRKGNIEGTYTLIWQSPEKWRETISLPGYTQVRLLDGNKMWRQRSSPIIPLQVFRVQHALNYADWLRPTPGQRFKKVKSRKKKGIRQWCLINEKGFGGPTLCFDSASGVLLRYANYPDSMELSDYQGWGNKVFPRTIMLFTGSHRIAGINVIRLSSLSQPHVGTFSPPAGATESPGCQDPKPPRRLNGSEPRYPSLAKEDHIAGIVRVIAKIELDGKVHDATVEDSPDKIFNTPVLNAIQNWTLQPASCHGTPVPLETEIDVKFSLSE